MSEPLLLTTIPPTKVSSSTELSRTPVSELIINNLEEVSPLERPMRYSLFELLSMASTPELKDSISGIVFNNVVVPVFVSIDRSSSILFI